MGLQNIKRRHITVHVTSLPFDSGKGYLRQNQAHQPMASREFTAASPRNSLSLSSFFAWPDYEPLA
jgi:hypothetical protein